MTEEMVVQKKRPDAITLIAIWQFFNAALWLLGAIAVGVGLVAVVTTSYGDDLVVGGFVLSVTIIILLVVMFVNIAAGWGLLALKDWARWLTIVLGVFALAGFPIWTAAGILKIWYLFTPEAKEAFGVS